MSFTIPSISKQAERNATYRKGAVEQTQKQNSMPALWNRSEKDQETKTVRYNPKCFWEAQRDPGKI